MIKKDYEKFIEIFRDLSPSTANLKTEKEFKAYRACYYLFLSSIVDVFKADNKDFNSILFLSKLKED